MIPTRLITDAELTSVQPLLDALTARLDAVTTLLTNTEASLKASLQAEQTTAQGKLDDNANTLIATLTDGIQAQLDRLQLLYFNPAEDAAALELVLDPQGRHYCCPANQAQSFRVHIQQIFQLAHAGMLVTTDPWLRPWYTYGGGG